MSIKIRLFRLMSFIHRMEYYTAIKINEKPLYGLI